VLLLTVTFELLVIVMKDAVDVNSDADSSELTVKLPPLSTATNEYEIDGVEPSKSTAQLVSDTELLHNNTLVRPFSDNASENVKFSNDTVETISRIPPATACPVGVEMPIVSPPLPPSTLMSCACDSVSGTLIEKELVGTI
jgi:hypothetical protein